MSEANNNPEVIHSLLHADEEIYPTFESPAEELAYLQTAYDQAQSEAQRTLDLTLNNTEDQSLLTKADNASNTANYWITKLQEFKAEHPELEK